MLYCHIAKSQYQVMFARSSAINSSTVGTMQQISPYDEKHKVSKSSSIKDKFH